MSDARPELHLRHVVLPWAQPEGLADADGPVTHSRIRDEALALKVSRDRLAIRQRGERDLADNAGGPRRRDLRPPLLPVALPFKPHPSIPDSDRRGLDEPALVSLAVALDVLATESRKVAGGTAVLAELTATLLRVGALGGIDDSAAARLLAHAGSRAGQIRASLSRQVSARMQAQPTAASEVTATTVSLASPSTPRAVGRAIRRIEAATAVVLREVRLRLEARDKGTEYRQA